MIALLAGLSLALPGVASASLQAGAQPLQTPGPDVVSATVNGATQATLCFDTGVTSPASGFYGIAPLAGTEVLPVTFADRSVGFTESGTGGTFVRGIHLRSYGLTGSLVPSDPVITNPVAAQADGNCLHLYFLPIWGAGVADNTVIEVEPGAVQDLAGRPNPPGTAALDGSTLVPLRGQTTGPKLLRAVPDDQARTVTYVYAAPVYPFPACGTGQSAACPTGVDPGDFGYYTAESNPTGGHVGDAIAGSTPNSITVHFPQVGADASPESGTRFFSMPGAVVRNNPNAAYPSSLDVVGRNGGNGAATDHPDLQSATPVAGSPGVYDLHYDRAVVSANPTGILPGCLAVPENPMEKGVALGIPGVGMIGHSLGRPGSDPKTIRISFNQSSGARTGPGVESLQDSKIVRVIDLGDAAAIGCALNLTTGLTSSRGEADVRIAPMQKGFTEGPDLVGVGVNRAAGTMTFAFDQMVAPSTALRGHLGAESGAGASTVEGLVGNGDLVSDAKPSTTLTVQVRGDVLGGAAGGALLSGGGFAGLPVTFGSSVRPDDIVPFLGLPATELPAPASPAVGDFTGAPALNQSAAAVPITSR